VLPGAACYKLTSSSSFPGLLFESTRNNKVLDALPTSREVKLLLYWKTILAIESGFLPPMGTGCPHATADASWQTAAPG